MGMGGQSQGSSTGSGIGAILGGIAGTFLLPGVGTALGATLGGGIGSLIGGAVDSGGNNDPRGNWGQNAADNPAAKKAEPLNRTVNVPPPSYQHGVQPEFSFFNKFDEGGPVLPLPQFNKPINSAGQTSMQQYFPNYTPTGPAANGSPSWSQIAAATAPTLAPLRTGVPSMQAQAFDPLTYGRTGPTPTPNPPSNIPGPPPSWQSDLDALRAQIEALRNPGGLSFAAPGYMQSGAFSPYGAGYSGAYGQFGDFSMGADLGYAGQGTATGMGGYGDISGADRGSTYAKGGAVGYAEGGQIPPPQQEAIYKETLLALQGRHPNPEPVIEAFIKIFGPAALNRLRMQMAAGIAGQVDDNPSLQGGVQPMGDGMSDSIPATVNGNQPARLSEGEFVIDAPTVAALGNGSTEAGIRQLEGMRQRIRQQAHGTPQQQNKVNPMAALPR